MELSTTIPNTRMNDISTTMFMVNPTKGIKIKAITMDSGMETPTKRALASPIKNIKTNTTTKNPRITVLNRSLTELRVCVLLSPVRVMIKFSGAVFL